MATAPTRKTAKAAPKTAAKAVVRPRAKAAAPADSALPAAGAKAPAFKLPADDGSAVTLKQLAGKKVVLYFYPKDDTPGCTTEAIAFSALKKKFDAAGAVVLGVSKDTVEKHCKFRDKHGLTVRLLSDEDGKTLEAYGVWGEKSLYGRKFMGITRTTVLIDGKGMVSKVWPKVKVKDHAEEVLAAVKEL
ncbi:MAG: thioredoxin-dependent thiol peroxidase [Parvibaculum sp.]|uniref:thioredoxin-dependent thiol peroxidase n=1 Tax=Parvibaculum sp. TaxID=2024848 RepID=UPI0027193FF7|nr:thioredoxin-dependent thiol peroxidase [Parvibaculum sp.]MDO8838177.1 thioredoxin-dependent thiol peroxidase [Parvibaculum sp.]